MLRFVLCLLILSISAPPVSASGAGDGLHVLNGRIIRALAIETNDPTHILVGQKAKASGSALVFQSFDAGKTWRTLNGNKPLHAKATDVQAVLAVSKEIILAGTWKHGLYLSRDGGRKFERIEPFPSADIRDLQTADGVIYAATARDGIFESTDTAQSWTSIGPGQDFIWSMTLTPDSLLASSPENAVYERKTPGSNWLNLFKTNGANAIAETPGSGGLRTVAGPKGLYFSSLKDWRKVLDNENFADVVITRNNRVIAGSWDNGVAVLTSGGTTEKRLLKGQAVVHLQIANRKLYAGTWGDGLHIIPLKHVLARGQGDTPLIAAVLSDDLLEVKRLLSAGADVDGYDRSRNTALIFATRDGQAEIAKLLLDAGADPGWLDGQRVTPLILAAFKNHVEIAQLLLTEKQKARTTHTDESGRSAKDYAKQRGTNDAIYQLLTQ